jgi:hypothetical protein
MDSVGPHLGQGEALVRRRAGAPVGWCVPSPPARREAMAVGVGRGNKPEGKGRRRS